MMIYILAQFIGFVGYIFYVSAPHFKTQQKIIQIGIIAYMILCLQWYLLEQYSLLTLNALGILISISALKARQDELIRKWVWVLYPFGICIIFMISHNNLIDIIAICTFIFTLRSQLSNDIMQFRGFAVIAGTLLIVSSTLALSIPAMMFNVIFTLIHAYHLSKLYLPRHEHALAQVNSV